MKFSWTLSAYLARIYVVHLCLLLLGLMAIVYFLDVVELIRRGRDHDDVSLALVLQMGLFKLPEVTQVLFPFAILFSAIFTFWSLTQKLELIVIRSVGFSALHFLLPVLSVAVLAGFLQVMVINPFGAYLISHYERLEANFLEKQESEIALFPDGIWLRQDTEDGYVILHSDSISQVDWELRNVSAFFFSMEHDFIKRLDASSGTLIPAAWVFYDAFIHQGYEERFEQDEFRLMTSLTRQDVLDSFSSPGAVAFWSLPSHIKVLEASGFDSSRLKIHYNNLLSQPFMFAAMVLIAAGVSMRLPRSGSAMMFIMVGLFAGLVVFFLSSFMQALGVSQQIPILLAAWAPALLSLLFGLSAVFYIEENS
jgi:lipopolysaccharide export system permease protein